ncbi:MAG TPA: LysR family transcriptional regulator [Polyangiaceae bacterium]|nr:LysR family transcriptional regulator [Polyangiaceae bacterium]
MFGARDLPLLAVFAAVVRLGSFTAAARELGLAKSVVSQHVRTLEARCGVRLLERTTRRLRVTQVGERVLEAAAPVGVAVREVARVLEAHREAPTGTLRVTAPYGLGSTIVTPAAARLALAHPGLRVDLVFDDALREPVAEGFDVALRLGPLRESSLVVRRLGAEPEIIVGADAMAPRHLAAARPGELADAPWVTHSLLGLRGLWSFRSEAGERDRLAVAPRALVSASSALRELVLAGVGFAAMPLHTVARDLAAGRLRQACPGWFRRRLTLQALLPSRESPPRVRLFLSHAAELAGELGFRPPRAA